MKEETKSNIVSQPLAAFFTEMNYFIMHADLSELERMTKLLIAKRLTIVKPQHRAQIFELGAESGDSNESDPTEE